MNNGIYVEYRKALDKYIKEMNDSVHYWIISSYKNNQIVGDESPIDKIVNSIKRVRNQWQLKFEKLSIKLSSRFVKKVEKFVTSKVKKSVVDVMTVDFEMTDQMKLNIESIVNVNVNLIKSIPSQYFKNIETLVLESVTRGRDISYLTDEIDKQFNVTRKRAKLIARDQNDKATVMLTKVRHQELGITEGIWMHSGGGKEPRPLHVKADGTIFTLSKGLPIGDGGRFVLPSEEINCRCLYRAVIKGFS